MDQLYEYLNVDECVPEVHAFAIRQLIEETSDIPPNGSNVIDVQQLLPSDGDINFITLISRYDFSSVSCFMVFFNLWF